MDRSVPLAFVDDVGAVAPRLSADDHHHLARVRRLRPGDTLTIGDGQGRWRPARLGGDDGAVEPAGDVVVEPAPQPPVVVAFALTKGDKPELAVQQLTEVGADRIVPFTAARSVVRWDAGKQPRATARLRAVARASAAQSHRAWIPTVEDPTTFADVAGRSGAVLAHPEGGSLTTVPGIVLIGPEGGWSAEEELALTSRVTLGPYVLRAATAATVAATLAVSLRRGFRFGG